VKNRILVTGARGLIGKEVLPFLSQNDYEIFCLTSSDYTNNNANWIRCDLTDIKSLNNVFEEIKPDYLLHFAWITGGDYLTNPINIDLKNSSFEMLKYFYQNGGKRAVYAGTCFEYDGLNGGEHRNSILKETSPTNPKTLYAKCKDELRQECFEYAKTSNLSFGWGRIFYVFGNNEKNTRLTSAAIHTLSEGKEFNLTTPNNCVDYMYTKDIAQAFVKFLESDYKGIVNICRGEGILLKDYVLKIQSLLGKDGLVKYDDKKPADLNVIGDNTILKDIVGYTPMYSIDEGLEEIIIKGLL